MSQDPTWKKHFYQTNLDLVLFDRNTGVFPENKKIILNTDFYLSKKYLFKKKRKYLVNLFSKNKYNNNKKTKTTNTCNRVKAIYKPVPNADFSNL